MTLSSSHLLKENIRIPFAAFAEFFESIFEVRRGTVGTRIL